MSDLISTFLRPGIRIQRLFGNLSRNQKMLLKAIIRYFMGGFAIIKISQG
jgi:hypothetical protein